MIILNLNSYSVLIYDTFCNFVIINGVIYIYMYGMKVHMLLLMTPSVTVLLW